MNRFTIFNTAILLPFITSMAAYILIFSHLSHPGCHFEMRKQIDLVHQLKSMELKEMVVQPTSIYPMDLDVMESMNLTSE
jgi:hypothetical protein